MKAIRVVGNLSNRSNYEYSDADVRRIVKALQSELSALEARFQQSDKKSQPEFKLQ
jgi:anti-sigma-K factor RskA